MRLLTLAFALLVLGACGDDAQVALTSDASAAHAADAATASDAGGGSDAAPQPGALCDPRAPACDGGEKCVATRWNLSEPWPAPRCVPELGEAGAGPDASCFSATGFADGCGTGLACTNFGTGEGYCHATCGAGEACSAGSVCAPVDPASGFALCMASCSEDEDCGAPGWKACVERAGVRYCEGARMND